MQLAARDAGSYELRMLYKGHRIELSDPKQLPDVPEQLPGQAGRWVADVSIIHFGGPNGDLEGSFFNDAESAETPEQATANAIDAAKQHIDKIGG